MDLNDGLFCQNGRCGYVLKPESLRGADKRFDPEVPQKWDGYKPVVLTVQVHKSCSPLKTKQYAFIDDVCFAGDQRAAASQGEHQRGLHSGPTGPGGDPWSPHGPGQAGDQIHREQWYKSWLNEHMKDAVHTHTRQLITDWFSLQDSTPCGTTRCASPCTLLSWPWCASWWRTTTRRPRTTLWASMHFL